MTVKQLTDQLIIEFTKFGERSGVLTSAFKNIYMKEIKSIQGQLIEHPDINHSIGSVTKLLNHDNHDVRERAALIIGELFKYDRLDESFINKCLEKLLRLMNDVQKSTPDSILREGEKLSNKQERILLTIRNLLIPNLDVLEFNDTTFNIEDIADSSICEPIEINEIVSKKTERKSVRDFFNKGYYADSCEKAR